MNRYKLKEQLQSGITLESIFKFTEGQDCMIYKGDFMRSDDIIYIPDLDLNEIATDRTLTNEEIEEAIEKCYSGWNFIDICNNHENVAKALFDFVDWQHPRTQDLTECYDEEEFMEIFGVSMDEL